MLTFAVLGPLDVRNDGVSVTPASAMQRKLLALLLSRHSEPVLVEQLLDALWDGRPPRTARKTLQIYVLRLRRTLGAEHIVLHDRAGYAAAVGDGELDADRFDDLVRRARQSRESGRLDAAGTLFEEALGLWRGPAYVDVWAGDLVSREVERLEEQRLTVVEDLAANNLDLGRCPEAMAQLRSVIGQSPYRERPQALLMLGLYRAGRRAEALECYRGARAVLADQLGIEPGPLLQRLHQLVLRDDAVLQRSDTASLERGEFATAPLPPINVESARSEGPCQLPPAESAFVGRQPEVARLRRVLDEPSGEADLGLVTGPPVVLIWGTAGIGKTTLAVYAAHLVRACYQDGQLFVPLRGSQQGAVPVAATHARLLRALGVPSDAIPDDPDERSALYRAVLADRRVLLVIDDVADDGQVWPLLPGAGGAVVVTSRVGHSRLANEHSILLDVMTPDQGVELITKIVGRERVMECIGAAESVASSCAGLPLALRVAAGRLATRPEYSLDDFALRLADERLRIDELSPRGHGVRASLDLSYQALNSPARTAFEILSVLEAPTVAAWTLAAVMESSIHRARGWLEELVDAGLAVHVGADAAGQDRYQMHDIVRAFGRDRAAYRGQRWVRTVVASAVAGWCSLSEVASRHLGPPFLPAPTWPDPPWPEIMTDAATDRPCQWFEAERSAIIAAVRQASTEDLDEAAWRLAAMLSSYCSAASDWDAWRDTLHDALGAVQRSANRPALAYVWSALGELHVYRADRAAALACLSRALPLVVELDDVRRTGYVLDLIGVVHRRARDLEAADWFFVRAREALWAARDSLGLAHVAHDLAISQGYRHQWREAAAMLEYAMVGFALAGDRRSVAHNHCWLAKAYLEQGRFDDARSRIDTASVIFDELGDKIGRAQCIRARAALAAATGQPRAAVELLDEALEMVREIGDPVWALTLHDALADLVMDSDADRAGRNLAEAARLAELLDRPQQVRDLRAKLRQLRRTGS